MSKAQVTVPTVVIPCWHHSQRHGAQSTKGTPCVWHRGRQTGWRDGVFGAHYVWFAAFPDNSHYLDPLRACANACEAMGYPAVVGTLDAPPTSFVVAGWDDARCCRVAS
jgi:hypothetical protein